MDSYPTLYARFKRNNPQIIAYRNRKWALLIVKWLIMVGVIMAIAFVAYPTSPFMLPFCTLLAIGLPLWRLKPWRSVKFHWIGTVEAISHENKYENADGSLINPFYGGRHTVTYSHFIVRDGKGKAHTFKLDSKYEAIYLVGDRVMNIPGVDYPIDLTVQDKTVCPRCGAIYPSENEHCVSIGCKAPKVKLDADDS